jgi:Fic family protein
MQKFTFNFQNGHKIIQKIGLIDEFKGKWSQQVSTDLPLEKLRILALSDNSSASVRLEKPTASVNDVLRNLYRNASNIVLNQTTLFSHETIEHIYECLEPQVTDNNFDKYRKQTSKLTLFIANQPISFRSMPTRNIAQQLKQEVHKTITYLNDKQLHPLIVIADFLYEFIAICPFATCNLQLSRLIAQQLLCQLNYNFIEYLAFEAAFEARKEQYHVSLTKALNSRNQVKEDISEWILFFLECIELSINHLEHRLKPFQAALKTLNTENFVLNEVYLEKPSKKQVVVVAAKTPIAKTIKPKNEKPIEIPATKVGGNKPEKNVKKPIVKKQNESSIELPLSQLFEDNTIKSIDNQSIKSVKMDTTTNDEYDFNQAELDEMVDNPMKSENDLSKSEAYLSPRQKKLKKFITERQPTRLGDLKKAFPEINQHIIKKDLQYMHRLNAIQKIGDFKTTVYTVNT